MIICSALLEEFKPDCPALAAGYGAYARFYLMDSFRSKTTK